MGNWCPNFRQDKKPTFFRSSQGHCSVTGEKIAEGYFEAVCWDARRGNYKSCNRYKQCGIVNGK